MALPENFQPILRALNTYSKESLSSYLRQALCSSRPNPLACTRTFAFSIPPTQAAILVPILKVSGQWSLLFIRRAQSNDPHSGQVAFPGGRVEKEDASIEAASLREAYEEIGLLPEDVEVLGRLPPILTVTNYQIHPVVGMIPYPYSFRLSPKEVQKIFTLPLEWLANPANYRLEERQLPDPIGRIATLYYRPYQTEVLWGASAQIVHMLLYQIGHQAPSPQKT